MKRKTYIESVHSMQYTRHRFRPCGTGRKGGRIRVNDWFRSARLLSWMTQFGLSVAVPLVGCILLAVWLQGRFGLGGWGGGVGRGAGPSGRGGWPDLLHPADGPPGRRRSEARCPRLPGQLLQWPLISQPYPAAWPFLTAVRNPRGRRASPWANTGTFWARFFA